MSLKRVFFIFLLSNSSSFAQSIHAVDAKVLAYPKHFSSLDNLAEKIKTDFQTDYDKARAVYVWVSNNVTYDLKAMRNNKSIIIKSKSTYEYEKKYNRLKNKRINKTFRSKKGICQNFSELYQILGVKVGLEVQLLVGNAKTKSYQIGKSSKKSNHAWNTVFADGRWILVDATWGSGYSVDDNKFIKKYDSFYFDTSPILFFKKHFPKTGIWDNETLDREAYEVLPLYTNLKIHNEHVLFPDKGVVQADDGDTIRLNIKNLKNENSFKIVGKGKVPLILNINNKEENQSSFEFIYRKKQGRYITLYIHNYSFAEIRIIPKFGN